MPSVVPYIVPMIEANTPLPGLSTEISPALAWRVVTMCLHCRGPLHTATRELRADRYARILADGYGSGVTDPELLWDWSHVRDSSDVAICAITEYLIRRFEGAGRLGQITSRL